MVKTMTCVRFDVDFPTVAALFFRWHSSGCVGGVLCLPKKLQIVRIDASALDIIQVHTCEVARDCCAMHAARRACA